MNVFKYGKKSCSCPITLGVKYSYFLSQMPLNAHCLSSAAWHAYIVRKSEWTDIVALIESYQNHIFIKNSQEQIAIETHSRSYREGLGSSHVSGVGGSLP